MSVNGYNARLTIGIRSGPCAEQLALLAGIRADPADDTARLVYADWLDENAGDSEEGRDRAALIRYEIALANLDLTAAARGDLDRRPLALTWGELNARHERLWRVYADRWFALPWAERHHVCRGFVGEVWCTADNWIRHGALARTAHPIAAVRLTTPLELACNGAEAWVAAHPAVRLAWTDLCAAKLEGDDSPADERWQVRAFLRCFWPRIRFDLR